MKPEELAVALNATPSGTGWKARCLFPQKHKNGDSTPSMNVFQGPNGDGLLSCMVCGTSTAELMKEARRLGLIEDTSKPKAKKKAYGTEEAQYIYENIKGAPVLMVVRYKNPKGFSQCKPDGSGGWEKGGIKNIPLFRLPEILKAPAVIVVEGEKDVLALVGIGVEATTNAGGAGKWKASYSESLRGRKVAIFADRDAPGRAHAQDVAAQLAGIAASVRVLEAPYPHHDVHNWISTGNIKRKDVGELVKSTPIWMPEDAAPAQVEEQPLDFHEWPHGLSVSDKGPRGIFLNALYAMRAHPDLVNSVAYDTFTSRTVVRKDLPWGTPAGSIWSDADDGEFCGWLQARDIRVGYDVAGKAVLTVAAKNEMDSLREYLEPLEWDGEPRLGWVASILGADDELSAELGMRWLVSAAARGLRPGCQVDHVLVLEGGQGIGKSTALRVLFDPLQKGWFRDDLPPLATKDAQQFLAGTWCVEIAELGAINAKRAELDHVKAFLSRRIDSYRPSYARNVREFPRRCVFAGSTNNLQYLKDTTGNRRFWPIKCCNNIDTDKLHNQTKNLWSEAVYLLKSGYPWWLDTNTPANQDLREQQEMRRISDPWEEQVLEYMKARDYITIDEILTHLDIPVVRRSQIEQNRIVNIVSLYGWTRKNFYDSNNKTRPRWKVYVRHPNITYANTELPGMN